MNPLEWVIGYQPTNQPTNNIGEIQMFFERILEEEKQDLARGFWMNLPVKDTIRQICLKPILLTEKAHFTILNTFYRLVFRLFVNFVSFFLRRFEHQGKKFFGLKFDSMKRLLTDYVEHLSS